MFNYILLWYLLSPALLRRATARTSLKERTEAVSDLEKVLALQPNHKKAQEQLNALRKVMEKEEGEGQEGGARRKGRRIQIQEVEGSGSEDDEEGAPSLRAQAEAMGDTPVLNGPVRPDQGGETSEADLQQSEAAEARTETDGAAFSASHPETRSTAASTSEQKPAVDDSHQPKPTENGATTTSEPSAPVRPPSPPPPPPPPPPLPSHVQQLKDEGNSLFRSGQYGEAVKVYTKALQHLEKGMYVSCACLGGEMCIFYRPGLGDKIACHQRTIIPFSNCHLKFSLSVSSDFA